MSRREYIQKFQELGYGLFVHFGLYSLMGKGEWYLKLNPHAEKKRYENLIRKFFVKENWAEQLVSVARRTGAKYIVLTARHHDGFSLYDTQGLNDYDAVHAACGRDLIKEFVSACKAADVVPFLYHTLSDWHSTKYTARCLDDTSAGKLVSYICEFEFADTKPADGEMTDKKIIHGNA